MSSAATRPSRRSFGKFTLIAKLAKGGMGEIYLAKLKGVAGFEKVVVIKRVLPHLAAQPRYMQMLRDEATVAAKLSHPNVCQVYELGAVDDEFYISMEYLEGVTLAELLKRIAKLKRTLDPRIVGSIFAQACEGLHAAHELTDASGVPSNLVHRDISPSNLFITAAGPVKILDFGIAKSPDNQVHTKTGAVKGKWAYMSPEQILRLDLDRRSDVFSLGVVLYEALTTRRLFRRKSEYETCQAITQADAPSVKLKRPDLSDDIAAVVAKALARNRGQRFATAREFGETLTQTMAPLGGPASLSALSELVLEHFTPEIEQRRRFLQATGTGIPAITPLEYSGSLPIIPRLETDPSLAGPSPDDPDETLGAHVPEQFDQPTVSLLPMMQPEPGEPSADPQPDAAALSAHPDAAALSAQPDVAALSAPTRRSRWKLWAAMFALLAACAAGLLVYLQSRARPASASAQVDVERGVIHPDGPAAVETASDDAVDAGAAKPDGDEAAKSDKGSRSGKNARSSKHKARKSDRNKASKKSDRYKRAISRKGRAVLGCFQQHADTTSKLPTVWVKLRIEPDGRVGKATLTPKEHNATALGGCLLKVVRAINFGKHDETTSIRVPLSVRVQ